jgi:hypothetical protein
MLGFELDFWDYATFATAALAGFSGVMIYIWIAGLPGRIALARNHPEAEAVKIMGWAGLLPTILPWIQAFIWAFKPTDIVDIRRFPKAEAIALDEERAHLTSDPRRKHGNAATAQAVPPSNTLTTAIPPRDAMAPPNPPKGAPQSAAPNVNPPPGGTKNATE